MLDPGGGGPLRQHRQQVGAVELPVGPPVPGAGRGPERQARHQPTGAVVAKLHRLGQAGARRRRLPEAERLEHGDPVRRDLQAGPHLGERRRLLEDDDPRPPPRQRRGRREPADAAADDGDIAPLEAHAGGSPAQAAARRARTPSRSTGRGFQ